MKYFDYRMYYAAYLICGLLSIRIMGLFATTVFGLRVGQLMFFLGSTFLFLFIILSIRLLYVRAQFKQAALVKPPNSCRDKDIKQWKLQNSVTVLDYHDGLRKLIEVLHQVINSIQIEHNTTHFNLMLQDSKFRQDNLLAALVKFKLIPSKDIKSLKIFLSPLKTNPY